MKKFIPILCFSFLLVQSNAQSNLSPTHLSEIGIPDSLYSDILDEQRQIWIHLPRDFNPDHQLGYPLLYVLDGGVHLNALANIMDYQVPGYIPEMIVVGISNRSNRTRDLTTSTVTQRHRRQVAESGGAEQFTAFIEKELFPYIDGKYPTTPYKTLIGHSYGGLFTINTLFKHTALFDNYIAIDPSLDWDDQKLLEEIKSKFIGKDFTRKSLYLTTANEIIRFSDVLDIHTVVDDTTEFSHFMRAQLEFVDLAKKHFKELNFSWTYYEDEIHGTVPLISMFDGLRTFFNWFPIKSPSKFNDPNTETAVLVKLVRDRGQRLTDHFGYPVPPFDEDLLNMLGYMYLEMEQHNKSKAFFKFAVEYYPQSANAYDSLADFYLSQNDYMMAQNSLQKAYELSGDDKYKKRMEEVHPKGEE